MGRVGLFWCPAPEGVKGKGGWYMRTGSAVGIHAQVVWVPGCLFCFGVIERCRTREK